MRQQLFLGLEREKLPFAKRFHAIGTVSVHVHREIEVIRREIRNPIAATQPLSSRTPCKANPASPPRRGWSPPRVSSRTHRQLAIPTPDAPFLPFCPWILSHSAKCKKLPRLPSGSHPLPDFSPWPEGAGWPSPVLRPGPRRTPWPRPGRADQRPRSANPDAQPFSSHQPRDPYS